MLVKSELISDKRYCPTIQGTKCLWMLPPDFNEIIGQASLGILQKFFADRSVQECVINLEKVTWADPVPLLCLGLLLAESNIDKNRILLKLGEIEDHQYNKDHQIFLKFFAKQGFLTAFSPYVSFQYKDDKATDVLVENVASFALQLSHISAPSYFNNADCILAKIIPVHCYKKDLPDLQRKVEELIHEMKNNIDQTAIVSDPFARDALYQKVRKILFELLLNVAEHAHPDRDKSFAGIYARVRAARPPKLSESKSWCELFEKKTVRLPGQKSFRPNHYAEWLELFICDTGVGLTDNIENWVAPEDDEEAAKALIRAQQAKNRFESICNRIFRSSFSSKSRNDKRRTAVTGLRHLGHLLGLDHDHCRMYSYERYHPGCWNGDHHPWKDDNTYSRTDILPKIKNQPKKYGHLIPVTGTVYAFSIQPNKERGLPCDKCKSLWQEERQEIIQILKQRTFFESQGIRIAWFDHRTKDSCPAPDKSDLPDSPYDVIVLRPSVMMNKADVASWLALVAGLRRKPPKIYCRKMFLVDLSPYQTLVFYELLRHEKVHPDTEMDWYLVSDQWDVCCLSTKQGYYNFNSDPKRSKKFSLPKEKNDGFSIADLAVLLRQMDSENFWNFDPPPGMNPFFKRPVIWKESHEHNQQLILPRYLDFPVALINPPQYHACLRALKRCLALFPGYQPKAADDLVLSLVREATISQRIEQGQPEIMVGSIVVTGKTLERLVQKEGQKALHIFCHAEVDHALPVKPLVALLWKSSLPDHAEKPDHADKKQVSYDKAWRRITTTSYIAKHGEKSISILRYRQNKDGSLDFNKPYYARTPEDTYHDFKRLGILKIGHWHYGSRHDLLTINMRLAFRFSFQELGPLYIWLQEQFKYFFTGSPNAKAKLLVYPSHPVTDTLFNLIRQDSGFKDKLPEGGMIPIKYVGRRTVSPLLASHLVKERIKHILNQRGWKKWSVVLFDDGTISGKHLRETKQLLQALSAETVYLLVVLDRSGLPVQEEVFDKFFRKHKRFWRWDVPGLGSEGKCPLCKALAVVEIHLHRVSSASIRQRLKNWLKIWELRDVDLKWYNNRIKTTVNIDPPLQITFGVDPKRVENGKPVEKRLTFTDATAATSIVMELTRLTPRMDVAVKKALKLHQDFPDAALELLTSQLFLFIDEMTETEVIERYKKLLEWLWERREETTFTAFAGLSFTLLKNMFIRDLWKFAYKLLKEKEMANLDIIFVVSYLCKRYELLTEKQYIPGKDAGNTEIQNFLALDRQVDVKKCIAALLALFISNPYHPNRKDNHSAEFKKNLLNIADGNADSNSAEVKKVIYDLKQLYKIIIFFSRELFVLEFDPGQESKLTNYIQSLASTTDSIAEDARNLHSYLYDEEPGLINIINKSLFASINGDIDFYQSITSIFNEIQNYWEQIVTEKIEYYKRTAKHYSAIKLWVNQTEKDGEEDVSWNKDMPSFSRSTINITGEKWFYYDKFYKRVVKDIFTNVLYSSNDIKDPFRNSDTSIEKAHMWWRVVDNEDFLVFETANETKNREIKFRQHSAIACIERTGGKLEAEIKEMDGDIAIAYIRLYLPKFSYFLGGKNET